MKLAWLLVEKDTYDATCTHQLVNKVFAQPDIMDLIGWKTEMAIWIPTIIISDTHEDITVDSSDNNLKCLKAIMDKSEYLECTTLDWEELEQPDYHSLNITDVMPMHTRKRMKKIHNQRQHNSWMWDGNRRRGSREYML